jgi:riboflavin biosynthesis pyrimidine reductase
VISELSTGAPIEDLLGAVFEEGRVADGRPWVFLNMVTSIDGSVTLHGGSTALSDDEDRALFHALRVVPDVILVGAGTVRAENYRPISLSGDKAAMRTAAGMSASPTLAIVSGSLAIDPGARVFSDPGNRPVILTGPAADPVRLSALSEVAAVEVLPALDGGSIVEALGNADRILCEGGPTLNGYLLSAGMVDEINWTISPNLLSGPGPRMADGPVAGPHTEMDLARAWRGERSLFLRYVRTP